MSDDEISSYLEGAISDGSLFGNELQSLFANPLSASATVKLNRFRHEESLIKPHITLNTKLDDIDVRLNLDQLISLKALFDHYRITFRNSHYVKYRPKDELKENPRAWWVYAYTSIVEERIRCYNWERMKLYRNQYRQYKKLYQEAIKSQSIPDNIAKEMDSLELELNLPTIMIARQHAKIEGKHVVKDAVYNLTIEEKEELYKMIGFNEQVGSDFKALTEILAQLDLSSVSFSLYDKANSLLTFKLLSLSSQLSIQPTIKSGDFRFEFSRISLEMDNGQGDKVSMLNSIVDKTKLVDDDTFMHFEFKKHSINSDSIADYDISFRLMPVEIIYEFAAINNVLCALKSSAIMEMITNAASQNLAKLSNYSTAGLIYAIENHKRLNVNALVHSPIIIIPQTGKRGGTGIVVYLGKAELSSDLTPSNVNDHSQLSRNMYDTFNLHLTNAQILMCETSTSYLLTDIDNKDHESRILKPASLDAVLLLSIRPSCHSLPQLVVKSNIDDIDFVLSDETIISMHKFLIDIPLPKLAAVKLGESVMYEEDVFYDPSFDNLTTSLNRDDLKKQLSFNEDSRKSESIPTLSETDDIWSSCFLGEQSSYTDLRENYTKYLIRFNMRKATIHIREAKFGPYLRLGMDGLNCDLALTAFGAAGAISVGSLQIIDVQEHSDILETSNDDLITLKYRFISSRCPSYSTAYESLPHFAKLQFKNLCFVCRQEFMIKLIRFGTGIMKKNRETEHFQCANE